MGMIGEPEEVREIVPDEDPVPLEVPETEPGEVPA